MFYSRLSRPPPIKWQGKHYALKTEAVISNGFRVEWIVNEWLVSWTNNTGLTERCFDKALILKGPHGQWLLSLIISRNKVKTLGPVSRCQRDTLLFYQTVISTFMLENCRIWCVVKTTCGDFDHVWVSMCISGMCNGLQTKYKLNTCLFNAVLYHESGLFPEG